MAAGDLISKGTAAIVGFNGCTFGTWIMQGSGEKQDAEVKKIRGAQNAPVTWLITNPHKKITVTGVLLSADLTAARSAKVGDVVSVNTVKYLIDQGGAPEIKFSGEDVQCTMGLIREDSMAAAIDA